MKLYEKIKIDHYLQIVLLQLWYSNSLKNHGFYFGQNNYQCSNK